MIIIKDK